MGIKNIENLKKVFFKLNSGIVEAICDEIKKEEYRKNNYEVWFYNTCDNSKSIVKVCDNKLKIEEESILEKYGREFIFYLWIECGEKKINYFYKDIDTSTLNIHVIPGVIQHYVKRGNSDVIKSPLLICDDQCLKMENVPFGNKYLPFSEKLGEYFWLPEDTDNDAILKLQKIKNFDLLCDELRNQLIEIRRDANNILKEIEGVESSLRGGLGVKPKYGFIEWINAKSNGIPFSFDLMYIFYREEVGILTAYDVINITSAAEKDKGKETNVLNYRLEGGTSVYIVYDVKTATQIESRSTDTHFGIENLYNTSIGIKKIIEKI